MDYPLFYLTTFLVVIPTSWVEKHNGERCSKECLWSSLDHSCSSASNLSDQLHTPPQWLPRHSPATLVSSALLPNAFGRILTPQRLSMWSGDHAWIYFYTFPVLFCFFLFHVPHFCSVSLLESFDVKWNHLYLPHCSERDMYRH
jgi:hypothetical protein